MDAPVSLLNKMSAEADETLIRLFADTGDDRAFAEIVTRHRSGIRRILYSVLNGNAEEISEVEQDVLVALSRSLPKFEFRASFKTWLYRFCRNKAIDFLRKKGRERKTGKLLFENAVAELSLSPPADPEDLDRQRLLHRFRYSWELSCSCTVRLPEGSGWV